MKLLASRKRWLVLTLAATLGSSPLHVHAHPGGHDKLEAEHDETEETAAAFDAAANPSGDPIAAQMAAVSTARAAAQNARLTGDTSLLRRAERALAPWDDEADVSSELLVVRANIKQINHRFDDALADLDIVLAKQPTNPQALLSSAFIKATTGDAESGLRDCAMLRPYVPLTIRETCVSRLAGLAGFLTESTKRMEALLRIVPTSKPEERAFALGVAGELAERSGDTELARKLYSELYESIPNFVYARAAYADFLIAVGETELATEVIGPEPKTEALLLLSALAGRGADEVSAAAIAELNNRIEADLAANDYAHAREYARFALDYLGDSMIALHFAEQNWLSQKEPVDALILARAAVATGATEVIEELKAWVAASRLESPKLDAVLAETEA